MTRSADAQVRHAGILPRGAGEVSRRSRVGGGVSTFLFILLSLLLASPALAGSITLLRSVTLDPDAPVTLADAARLDGDDARALGAIVLAASPDDLPRDPDGSRRLDLATVRAALDARPGINWAFLTLRGAEVRILDRAKNAPTTVAANAAPDRARADDTPRPTIPGSIGQLAERVLCTILKADPADARIRWRDADRELLDEPVAGRVITVQPIGTSARMPLSVTIYAGDRIVRTETVRAEVAIRRDAWVIARPAPRGTALTEEHVTRRVMWLEPGIDPAPAAVGQVAARRLDPGAVVQGQDVAPPIAIERGETFMLHTVAGAIALKSRARALEPGRDGDVIRVEMLGSGKRVSARVNGPGRAVLVVPTNSAPADTATGARQ